jgi:hypothetical protein
MRGRKYGIGNLVASLQSLTNIGSWPRPVEQLPAVTVCNRVIHDLRWRSLNDGLGSRSARHGESLKGRFGPLAEFNRAIRTQALWGNLAAHCNLV